MKRPIARILLLLASAALAGSCSKKDDAASAVHESQARKAQITAADATADGDTTSAAPAAVVSILDAIEDAENELARDTFDPAAVIQTVGHDPQELLAWMREQTRWVPYRGALRGYVGVLMDRLGNDLDRSLLLAELLTQAGHEVRLASRSLTQEQVTELLEVVAAIRPRTARSKTNPTPMSEADLQRYSQLLRIDPDELKTRVRKFSERVDGMAGEMTMRLDAQVPFLAGMIGDSRATDEWDRRAASALQDHWWVQLNDGSDWIDLDPLLPASRPSGSLGAAERTFTYSSSDMSIPLESSLVHEVSIRVFVQQTTSDAMAEHKVFEHSLRALGEHLECVLRGERHHAKDSIDKL